MEGDPIPDFTRSEVQRGEYERLTYINQATNAYTNMVRSPAERMADGVFVGFYHTQTAAAIPRTNFHFEIEFYSNTDWSWVSTPKQASGPIAAGTAVTLHLAFSKPLTAGQDYKGELQLGPPVAPTLLSVPI